jgi:hypothetical protein
MEGHSSTFVTSLSLLGVVSRQMMCVLNVDRNMSNVGRDYYLVCTRGVINGKAGKATALPKFLDTLILSHSWGADYAQPLSLPHLNKFRDYAPVYLHHNAQWLTLVIDRPFNSFSKIFLK